MSRQFFGFDRRIAQELRHMLVNPALCQFFGRSEQEVLGKCDQELLPLSDDGCGMDKDTLSHLFEPFFTIKGVGKGTGLGLATVYGIVKQNKGFIDVRSEPGIGSNFRIYLPQHVGESVERQTQERTAVLARGQDTVLLVEDEPEMLRVTERMLQGLGYLVLAASGSAEAIAMARMHAGEIHVLLTDVVMPEMNGRALAELLRSTRANLKCLFMSGYTADVIAHHGVLDAGVHFIQKPFSAGDVAVKLREVLGER